MQVWTQRIVFGAEINSFGLSEREVREVLNKVVREKPYWEVSDIRNGRRDCLEIFLEFNETGRPNIGCEIYEEIKKAAENLFKLIESELARYAALKPFLETYYKCNGHNGRCEDAKEIMRKIGIPVIS